MELKPITFIPWEALKLMPSKPFSKFNPAADFSQHTSASPARVVPKCSQCYQSFPVGDSQWAFDNSNMQINSGRKKSVSAFAMQCHFVALKRPKKSSSDELTVFSPVGLGGDKFVPSLFWRKKKLTIPLVRPPPSLLLVWTPWLHGSDYLGD